MSFNLLSSEKEFLALRSHSSFYEFFSTPGDLGATWSWLTSCWPVVVSPESKPGVGTLLSVLLGQRRREKGGEASRKIVKVRLVSWCVCMYVCGAKDGVQDSIHARQVLYP